MNDNYRYAIIIAATIVASSLLTFILRKLLHKFIEKYSKKMKTDPTNFSFIKNSISYFIYTLGLVYIFMNIPALHSLGSALFAGAGVLAAIIGFASQKAFSNIVSGVFILVFKPFRVGDTIESANLNKGKVEEVTLRHTIIRNYENRRIVIPNHIISEETIVNSDMIDSLILRHIEFGISYDSNIDKAMAIIQEEARKHPLFIDNRTEEDIAGDVPDVRVRLISMTDFSVNLRAYVWADSNDNAFYLSCDLLKSVKERFDNEGIEIPFPYRTIVFKKDIGDNNEKKEKEAE